MQAGDTVYVHAGTYREWVKPPRSGESDAKRIVYKAAPGELVKIKGSEQINTWVSQGNGIWKVDLPESYFNGYNPYAKMISWDDPADCYLVNGSWHYRGDVYFNENGLHEKQNWSDVQSAPNTWIRSVSGTTTTITANFGAANPNTELTEINVRHSVIWPDQLGISYITIDGFTVMHSAEEWTGASGSNGIPQWGAIGPRWGRSWIIQNCRVKNARCIGICIGNERASDQDFTKFGHHIVRNNWISNCAMAGVAGERGCAGSTIEGNLIEDINDREEFGGYEEGGIKLHFVVDVLIKDNCIRRIHANTSPGNGIWLDWSCQNTRVTGNLFYSCAGDIINLEVFHGPVLFDNNIFIGDMCKNTSNWSSNICYINNLFYDVNLKSGTALGRNSPTFTPHSLVRNGSLVAGCGGWRVYNNIIVGGKNDLWNHPQSGIYADYNAYLQGSVNAEESHYVQDASNMTFSKSEADGKVTLSFSLPATVEALSCSQIASSFLGTFPESNVTLTHPDNSPMNVDGDYFGNPVPLSNAKVGPFQDVQQGNNSYVVWPKGPLPNPTAIANRGKSLGRQFLRVRGSAVEATVFDVRGRKISPRLVRLGTINQIVISSSGKIRMWRAGLGR
jgi:hypothetical protein